MRQRKINLPWDAMLKKMGKVVETLKRLLLFMFFFSPLVYRRGIIINSSKTLDNIFFLYLSSHSRGQSLHWKLFSKFPAKIEGRKFSPQQRWNEQTVKVVRVVKTNKSTRTRRKVNEVYQQAWMLRRVKSFLAKINIFFSEQFIY